MTHWINPWDDAIPVSIEELAACHVGLNEYWLDASTNTRFLMTEEKLLEHWRTAGDKLDPYVLECSSGYHCIGIRYGNEPSEYLSPAGDKDKIRSLLNKYKGGRVNLPQDRCQCAEPKKGYGSVLCQFCLGNLP